MQEELALTALLRETVDEGLYQIILSNPREKEKAHKIKVRPVMIRGKLLFQKTVYAGTQVFHENLEQEELIGQIERLLAQDFRQGEIEHRRCKAVVMVSKKGKTTIKRKRTDDTGTTTEADRSMRLSHNRVKRYILEEGVPVRFWWIWVCRRMREKLSARVTISLSRSTVFWNLSRIFCRHSHRRGLCAS